MHFKNSLLLVANTSQAFIKVMKYSLFFFSFFFLVCVTFLYQLQQLQAHNRWWLDASRLRQAEEVKLIPLGIYST